MQFPVPQFIGVEDKIIGPLTLRQFLTLIGGAVICVAAWSMADMELFILITIIVGSISIAFAFVKMNGRLLHEYLLSMLNYFSKPQIRTWAKDASLKTIEVSSPKKVKRTEHEGMLKEELNKSRINDLSEVLDAYGEQTSPIESGPPDNEDLLNTEK